jgi:hypothetical protein
MKHHREDSSEKIQQLHVCMQWIVESTLTFDRGGMDPGAAEDMSMDSKR